MREFRLRVLVFFAAFAIVASGCSSLPKGRGPDPTPMSSTSSSISDPDIGLPGVSLPADAESTVTVEATEDPVPQTELITARSDLVRVSTDVPWSASEGAEVRWPLPANWDPAWHPVVVWEDGSGGWRWLPTELVSDADGDFAVARTDHFSRGFLASFDPRRFARDIASDAGDLLTGRAGAMAPVCDGGDAIENLVEVVTDAAPGGGGRQDAVLWCAGVRDGEPIVTITNNRRILAQVLIPTNATVIDQDRGISLSRGVTAIGAGLETLAQGLPQDREVLLLEAGASLTIQLPRGEQSGLQVSASGVGYALSTLVLGMDTYLTVATAAGLDVRASSGDLLHLLGTGEGSNLDWALAALDCLRNFTDTYTHDMTSEVDLSTEIERSLGFLFSCGTTIGAVSIDVSGPFAWIISATISTLAGLIALAVTALELLIGAMREAVDSLVTQTRGTVTFTTLPHAVTPPTSPPLLSLHDLRGDWSGQMFQPTSAASPYSMDVSFTGGELGSPVAVVRYDDLSCGGYWTLIDITPERVTVKETITYGRRCIDVELQVWRDGSAGTMHVQNIAVNAELAAAQSALPIPLESPDGD